MLKMALKDSKLMGRVASTNVGITQSTPPPTTTLTHAPRPLTRARNERYHHCCSIRDIVDVYHYKMCPANVYNVYHNV